MTAFVLNDRRETALVASADPAVRDRLIRAVEAEGCLALACGTPFEALDRLDEAAPDLLVLDAGTGDQKSLTVLEALRADEGGDGVPAVVLTAGRDRAAKLAALAAGADDVIGRSVASAELRARIRVRLERPPVPRRHLATDPVTGALTPDAFAARLGNEIERVGRGGRPGAVAFVSFHELPALHAELGSRARDELLAQVVRIVKADGRRLDVIGMARSQLALLLPDTPAQGAQVRLERLMRKLHEHPFTVGRRTVRLTPIIGHAASLAGVDVEERAWVALLHAADQLDLYPTPWQPQMTPAPAPAGRVRRTLRRWRTPLQVAFQQLLWFGIPLGFYFAMDQLAVDLTGAVYLVVVVALALTSLGIWCECIAALRRRAEPSLATGAPPPASAVIAAYLPNECDTVVETVEAFLRQDYPDLQVILAYNTPEPLPVEDALRAIAARDPRFMPLRVEGSVSKAQNVNAALARARGAFVGIFDADHHPANGSFNRAWRWLESGVDVVQGHCVVRNGADGRLTRLVATEFEAMYAVSHPGRARLHGFGIFGGSNGYWRRGMLERIRLRSFMLTEDIDSSLRVLRAGGRIVSDPGLVSTELAPDRVGALWNQRLRWAQGWSQVALRHLWAAIRTRELTVRQRLGAAHLLGWRELYPWLSLQVGPILLYWLVRGEPPVEWFVPLFVVSTVFTLSAGPMQAWTAWRLAHPSIRRQRGWFLAFAVASGLFYTEFKNVIARTAHLKEAMRERTWKVTPRAASAAASVGNLEPAPQPAP